VNDSGVVVTQSASGLRWQKQGQPGGDFGFASARRYPDWAPAVHLE
jgi:hypothetical protein